MSNNLYDILAKFNAVDKKQEPVQQPKAKTKLAENMETVEGQLSEKYMGFKKTVAAIKKGGSADNPEAVAAAIGRKKYGKEKFQQAAAAGKKLGEEQGVAEGMEKGEYSRVLAALGLYYPRVSMEELNVPGYHKVIANKANVPVEYAAQVINDFVRATEPEDEDWMQDVAEAAAQYTKDEIISILSGDKTQAQVDAERKAQQPTAQPATTQQPGTKTNEVAPPGAKAERMVKHIKKGYAKDGKLSDKEKSIAYATAWKAHKAGKVEEAVAALTVLARSGMTAQQITEGWEDMMKAVSSKSREEKGTGKFDKKKDPTTGGTVYSRKYNPKTGETDDTENVTAVKRGRGRPKKSAFEQYMQKYEAMLEDADPLGKFIKGLDQKGASAKTAPAPAPAMGTIKNGVWTADAPKPGEKGVPLPVPVDEADADAAKMGRWQGGAGDRAGVTTNSLGIKANKQDAAAASLGRWLGSTDPSSGWNKPVDEANKGPTNAAALGNDPSNPLNNKMGGYQEFMPKTASSARTAPTGPDQSSAETARLARYAQQAAQNKAAVTPSSAVPPKPVEGPGGAAFGIYPKAFPNRQAPVKPSSGMSAADFQRTDKDTTQVPMPVRPGDGLDASGRRTTATDPRVVKPAATKPAPAKPAPQRVATTYTGPEGDEGEAQAQLAKIPGSTQGERDDAAATDLANQPTSSARQRPPGAVPLAKPPGIPVRDGSGQIVRSADGQPVTSRSADEIGDTDAYTGEYKPGSYEKRMQQGQKNLDAVKNFFGIGKEKAAPADQSEYKPAADQTVAESDYELEEMMRLAGMGEALKGGQKKLDKNHNGKLDAEDFDMLRRHADKVDEVSKGEYIQQQDDAAEKAGKDKFTAFGQEFDTDEVDENFYPTIPAPANADSIEQAKRAGAARPAEPGKPDPFAAGDIIMKPKAVDEGHETCTECGYTMTECGCDAGHEESHEGHMNISMNADSDGNQSMTVSADGEDAVKLAQLLKLAGLGSGQPEAVYHPVEVVVGDEEEEIEEEKDPRYHASTTPDEEVFGVDTQIKGGNGDVAGQEKKMTPHGYQFGDNPIAMKETVARDYESIKVRK